ncbi:hypothetical protein LJC42_00305 [Eubacteriales bacterium OttesenSCG-928-K08]|nr:hypothetical protein [Eubacteriales bacterium OttesenSCG-928-K08]
MLDAVFQAVRDMAIAFCTPYKTIDSGAMPKDNGLAMFLGPGAPTDTYLDRATTDSITIALNGKHSKQQVVLAALSNIHHALSVLDAYPEGDGWKILEIETSARPSYVDREDSGSKQWIYGSLLNVTVYFKGVC